MQEKKNIKEQLNSLDEIISNIESGDLSLDDAIKEYEKGQEIVKYLEKAISEAKQKVETIIDTKGK